MTEEKIDLSLFEDSLSKLENVVNEMEAGKSSLDSMISKYAEGVDLFKKCKKMLDHAEMRITQITDELKSEIDD